jgi:hypothetical protein
MPIAASSPTDRVDQLIILTKKLTEEIERETQLLRAHRPHELGDVIEAKARLAALYSAEMTAIRKNRKLIEGASAEVMAAFRRVTELFRAALADHERILNRVRGMTEGMVKAIADELAARQRPPQGYGRGATPASAGKATAPASLTLNQVI